jgi:hypothetical protein
MLDEIGFGRELFRLLERLDEGLARRVAAGGCPRCAGPLHRGDHGRKPLGALIAPAGEAFVVRFSLCCGREGCGKRATPPSVRFLGRRVHLGAVVIVASLVALAFRGAGEIRRRTGVPARTTQRWLGWWQGPFLDTEVFVTICARLIGVEVGRVPASMVPWASAMGPSSLRDHRSAAGLAAGAWPACRSHPRACEQVVEASDHGRGSPLLGQDHRADVLPDAERGGPSPRARAQGPQARGHASERVGRARGDARAAVPGPPAVELQAPPRQPRGPGEGGPVERADGGLRDGVPLPEGPWPGTSARASTPARQAGRGGGGRAAREALLRARARQRALALRLPRGPEEGAHRLRRAQDPSPARHPRRLLARVLPRSGTRTRRAPRTSSTASARGSRSAGFRAPRSTMAAVR